MADRSHYRWKRWHTPRARYWRHPAAPALGVGRVRGKITHRTLTDTSSSRESSPAEAREIYLPDGTKKTLPAYPWPGSDKAVARMMLVYVGWMALIGMVAVGVCLVIVAATSGGWGFLHGGWWGFRAFPPDAVDRIFNSK